MSGKARPALLFIAPIMPRRDGNGLAMRAGMMLEGLARRFEVHLFVVPVAGGSTEATDFVRDLTARVGVLDMADGLDPQAALIGRVRDRAEHLRHRLAYPRPWSSRFSGRAAARQIEAWMGQTVADAVHVMRLHLALLAVHFLHSAKPPAPLALLDLDDDDAQVHERMARLHEIHGDSALAEIERAEAAKVAKLAAGVLATFDAAFICSDEDAARLALTYPAARFHVLPNGYAAGAAEPNTARINHQDGRLRLLLLGNFGYLPNADAARYLVTEILPALHRLGACVHIDIVGVGGSPAMLGDTAPDHPASSIAVHGEVASVSPWYRAADIAVVPLRAGGGTRIKILEAFAHGLPVVSTRIGAEGLAMVPGTHLLCADSPTDFALACLRLSQDAGARAEIVANATDLLHRRYTTSCVHARLDAILEGLLVDGSLR